VGAVPIHAFGGATGTILIAFLVSPEQLPAGSRILQLVIQIAGVLVNFVWAFGLGLALFYLLDRAVGLRVTPEEEEKGLNIVEFDDIYSWADFLKTTRYENVVFQQNEVLKKQARLLIATQEQERVKLGRDLHDGVGQSMAAVKLQLGILLDKLKRKNQGMLENDVARTLNLVDSAIEDMRGTLLNLRPTMLKDQGLQKTIRYMATSIEQSTGVTVSLNFAEEMPVWGEAVELNIYRIVQECVTNVIKHASAAKLELYFGRTGDDSYAIKIVDDGKGFVFDTAAAGIGLTSIQERAAMLGGRVLIQSSPGVGTTVLLEVPLEKNTGVGC